MSILDMIAKGGSSRSPMAVTDRARQGISDQMAQEKHGVLMAKEKAQMQQAAEVAALRRQAADAKTTKEQNAYLRRMEILYPKESKFNSDAIKSANEAQTSELLMRQRVIGSYIEAIKGSKDPGQRQQLWTEGLQKMNEMNIDTSKLDPSFMKAVEQGQWHRELSMFQTTNMYLNKRIKKLEMQKLNAEIDKNKAQALKFRAEAAAGGTTGGKPFGGGAHGLAMKAQLDKWRLDMSRRGVTVTPEMEIDARALAGRGFLEQEVTERHPDGRLLTKAKVHNYLDGYVPGKNKGAIPRSKVVAKGKIASAMDKVDRILPDMKVILTPGNTGISGAFKTSKYASLLRQGQQWMTGKGTLGKDARQLIGDFQEIVYALRPLVTEENRFTDKDQDYLDRMIGLPASAWDRMFEDYVVVKGKYDRILRIRSDLQKRVNRGETVYFDDTIAAKIAKSRGSSVSRSEVGQKKQESARERLIRHRQKHGEL